MESLFIAALQSSFLLGLIHGVNPCGHSWLVLAPFVAGEKQGRKVAGLTSAFLIGTGLACLALGATLGAVSMLLPPRATYWVEITTSMLLMLVGLVLLYDPHILHSHSHDGHDHHDHNHDCHHDHDHNHARPITPPAHQHHGCSCTRTDKENHRSYTNRKWLAASLFAIGFVNMVIPCPTAAVMYGYALHSGSTMTATLVFGSYALSTAIAVGLVIYLIFKVTTMAGRLQKEWVEPLIMRSAGLIILLFSSYGIYSTITS